eukprot:1669218-Alexandrium_andersonii.AAC.1
MTKTGLEVEHCTGEGGTEEGLRADAPERETGRAAPYVRAQSTLRPSAAEGARSGAQQAS